ncbi:MAG: hypothetical protein ACE5HI_06030 [bacterium]
MKIPNADHEVVDIRKLRDYCLKPMQRYQQLAILLDYLQEKY